MEMAWSIAKVRHGDGMVNYEGKTWRWHGHWSITKVRYKMAWSITKARHGNGVVNYEGETWRWHGQLRRSDMEMVWSIDPLRVYFFERTLHRDLKVWIM